MCRSSSVSKTLWFLNANMKVTSLPSRRYGSLPAIATRSTTVCPSVLAKPVRRRPSCAWYRLASPRTSPRSSMTWAMGVTQVSASSSTSRKTRMSLKRTYQKSAGATSANGSGVPPVGLASAAVIFAQGCSSSAGPSSSETGIVAGPGFTRSRSPRSCCNASCIEVAAVVVCMSSDSSVRRGRAAAATVAPPPLLAPVTADHTRPAANSFHGCEERPIHHGVPVPRRSFANTSPQRRGRSASLDVSAAPLAEKGIAVQVRPPELATA